MTSMPRDKLLQKWKMLWKCLVDLNVTSLQSCDKTSSELKSFEDDNLSKLHQEFEKFSPEILEIYEARRFHFLRYKKFFQDAAVLRVHEKGYKKHKVSFW